MNWYTWTLDNKPVGGRRGGELARGGKINRTHWSGGRHGELAAYSQTILMTTIRAVAVAVGQAIRADWATREAVCVECGKIFNMDDMIPRRRLRVRELQGGVQPK
jgi:hypothetical protein